MMEVGKRCITEKTGVVGYCEMWISSIALKCPSQTSAPLCSVECWHKSKRLLISLKASRGYIVVKRLNNVNSFLDILIGFRIPGRNRICLSILDL